MVDQWIFRSVGIVCLLGLMACGETEEATEGTDTVITTPEKEVEKEVEKEDTKEDEEIETEEEFLTSPNSITSWIISAEATKIYLKNGDGMLLDTRSEADFDADNIDGSQRVDWTAYSMTEEAERGELLPIGEIGALLEGLTEKKWVFVIGDPTNGWGEEGRIVWMLKALGHKNVAMIDGGYPAAKMLAEPKAEPETKPATMPDVPEYKPSVSAYAYSASADDVKDAITSDVQLIDVREKREFDGETPYGETRGGHVPTAIHLHYKSLLGSDGKLLSRKEIKDVLVAAGLDLDKPAIAYCTGGVRSAWLTSILVALELDVTNYAGSMWQWSSYPAEDFPLE